MSYKIHIMYFIIVGDVWTFSKMNNSQIARRIIYVVNNYNILICLFRLRMNNYLNYYNFRFLN